MKLLPKTEIQKRRSDEQVLDIREGAKLAKTIDALRQTKGKEEDTLRKFREQSISIIKHDLDLLLKEKESLVVEVKDLQHERILAQTPVDLVKEWETVRNDRIEIDSLKSDLLNRETDLISKESNVEVKEKEFIDREEVIKEREKITEEYQTETHKQYAIAERVRLNTEKEMSVFSEEKTREETKIRNLYEDIAIKERDIALEKDQVVKEKADIETEKLHIASQQKTLRQAWTNIKKLTQ